MQHEVLVSILGLLASFPEKCPTIRDKPTDTKFYASEHVTVDVYIMSRVHTWKVVANVLKHK